MLYSEKPQHSITVALAATGKFQNETKQNELKACRDKLVGGTTSQVVFKGRQVNHGKPKLTFIGDLLHQNKRSLTEITRCNKFLSI